MSEFKSFVFVGHVRSRYRHNVHSPRVGNDRAPATSKGHGTASKRNQSNRGQRKRRGRGRSRENVLPKGSAFRLHPPFPLLVPRHSTQDVKIKGYDREPGSQVLVNAWAIGRDPSLWGGDAGEFRPERFMSSKIDYKGQHFELIPFGAGRRICPAILFAMAVNEIALANVIHKFDWSKTRVSDSDMAETSGLTAQRKFPLMAFPKW